MGKYSVPEEIRAMKPRGTCVKNIKGHYYVYEQNQSSGKMAVDGHVVKCCPHQNDTAAYGNKYRQIKDMQMNILLEDTNADLIRQEVPKIERLKILGEKAYRQLEIFIDFLKETDLGSQYPKERFGSCADAYRSRNWKSSYEKIA